MTTQSDDEDPFPPLSDLPPTPHEPNSGLDELLTFGDEATLDPSDEPFADLSEDTFTKPIAIPPEDVVIEHEASDILPDDFPDFSKIKIQADFLQAEHLQSIEQSLPRKSWEEIYGESSFHQNFSVNFEHLKDLATTSEPEPEHQSKPAPELEQEPEPEPEPEPQWEPELAIGPAPQIEPLDVLPEAIPSIPDEVFSPAIETAKELENFSDVAEHLESMPLISGAHSVQNSDYALILTSLGSMDLEALKQILDGFIPEGSPSLDLLSKQMEQNQILLSRLSEVTCFYLAKELARFAVSFRLIPMDLLANYLSIPRDSQRGLFAMTQPPAGEKC